MTDPTIQDEILVLGLDDWIRLDLIDGVLYRHFPALAPAQRRTKTLDLIATLLRDDLLRVGQFEGEKGFVLWDIPVEEALSQIGREWERIGDQIGPGDVCWFDNTAMGDARARAFLRRRI